MGLDARSRERLAQLGRQLPQPLPQPDARDSPATPPAGRGGRLHRLETETDPQALFHELMQASPDGNVPPHLLQRLRELERTPPAAPAALAAPPSSRGATSATRAGTPRSEPGREQDPRYVSFEQMLLEDESL